MAEDKEEKIWDDENFNEEGGGYSNKSDFSKAEVVKQQVVKCNEIRSKEMREGYFNYDKFGNKVYIPDARREWDSAVKALRKCLEPEVRRDKGYQEKEKEFVKRLKEIFDSFAIYPEALNGKSISVDTSKGKFIPKIDQKFPVSFGSSKNKTHVEFMPKHNANHHMYWDAMVDLNDDIFAELNVLIDKNDYFKQKLSF